jgi:hypothetical protein
VGPVRRRKRSPPDPFGLRISWHYTLDSLNSRIAELLEELNARTMRVYQTSRTTLFEKIERQALRPLPTRAFTYG